MSGEAEDGDTCVVCFKNAEYYSIGQCDHPVCYECSTRMRVLCQQNECPICRQDMPKVIFVDKVRPFRESRDHIWEKRYKIGFSNSKLEAAYKRLLQHRCRICSDHVEFKTFNALKDHMRREHDLFFCELCVANLKIFSSERRCYKRSELGVHRRKGDADDRSHRGHPLCEFCDERFMDNDELFRHLRRNHLFCHFCDADGHHRYFGSYDYLRDHFRSEHFLCEEGDCKEEKFTSVFRSEIDLKAHRASAHARTLGKAAVKQARTLELEFTLAPRPRNNAISQRRPYSSTNDDTDGAVGYTSPVSSSALVPSEPPAVNTQCRDNFPSLSGGQDNVPVVGAQRGGRTIQYRGGGGRFNMTEENFPALHGGVPNQTVNISLQRNAGVNPAANNLSIKVKHRPHRAEQPVPSGPPSRGLAEFPTLGTPSVNHSGAISWKGTVAPRTSNVTKQPAQPFQPPQQLHERFSTSCQVAGTTCNGVSSMSLSQPSPSSATAAVKPKAQQNCTAQVSASATKSPQSSKPVPTKATSTKVTVATSQTEEVKSGKSKKKKNKSSQPSSASSSSALSAAHARPSPSPASTSSSSSATTSAKVSKPIKPIMEERKCSELKIGALREDQRPLSHVTPALALAPPPGFSTPISSTSSAPVAPPPGFSVTLNSIVRPVNGLTSFTNSSGQSFPIRQVAGEFQRPSNFDQRNADLVQSVAQALQKRNESGGLATFKQISSQFRRGSLEASEYYQKCKEAMGNDTFSAIFPELLALLPDIRKQQELWRAHGRKGLLEECPTCGQVVRSSDARAHHSSHVRDSHFPALSDQVTGLPSWPISRK